MPKYKKPTRNWLSCRLCGVQHTNPASSSLCTSCGDKLAYEKAKDIATYETNVAASERNTKLSYLRTECGMGMQESRNFLKAFNFLMENQ